MKRYNLVFGKVGCMALAKDGEWCRVEHAEKEMARLEVKYIKQKGNIIDIYRNSLLRKTEEAEFYKSLTAISIAINIGLIAGFVVSRYLV